MNMLINVNWKIIKTSQNKSFYCHINKLLKKPHGEKSPPTGLLKVNFLTNALAAFHSHDYKKQSKNKDIKKTIKENEIKI